MPHPACVPIHLGELRLAESFLTPLTARRGTVIDWGWVDVDGAHVKAVLCRVETEERTYAADMVVLVPWDRPHARWDHDTDRWDVELQPAPRPRALPVPQPALVM